MKLPTLHKRTIFTARERLFGFFFRDETDDWLAILRIGLGALVVSHCLSLYHSWNQLLSLTSGGLLGREVSEALITTESPWIPKVAWILEATRRAGIETPTAISLIWVLLLVAAVLLIIGFFSRTAAATCWLLHLCAAKSGTFVSYGVDNLMTTGLFYLMLSPLPDRWALDARLWKKTASKPSLLGFFRRVLQLHLCVVYFFGGLAKALGSGWWNGENLWRALTRPPFDVLPPESILSMKIFLPALGISIWLIELSYPILIWPRKTRLLWLTLICLLHFGIGFAMGMPLFALVMIVLNVAAFGPAHDAAARFLITRQLAA